MGRFGTRDLGAAFTSFAVVATIVLAGCSGSEGSVDLTTPTPDPSDPADPPAECTAIAPACTAGDTRVAKEADCAGAEYCYSRSTSCKGKVTATIWCGHFEEECNAAPSCNGGDSVVATCPPGSTCYTRTACGQQILCAKPNPNCPAKCDPGDLKITEAVCASGKVTCYSRTQCNQTIWCQDI
jgi:hypothetical protein